MNLLRLTQVSVMATIMLSGAGNAENWRSVAKSQSGDIEYFIDTDSVRQAGEQVTAWSSEKLKTPIFRGLFKPAGYQRLAQNAYDCARGTSALLRVVVRGESGETLDNHTYQAADIKVNSLVPGSVGEQMLKSVCGIQSASSAGRSDNYDPNDPPRDAFSKYSWKFISNANDNSAMYLGTDSVTPGEGKYASAVFLLSRIDSPPTLPGPKTFAVQRVVIDCQNRQYVLGNKAQFDADGAFLRRDLASDLKPQAIAERTIAAGYLDAACKNLQTASASATPPSLPKPEVAPKEKESKGSFGTAWLSDTGYLITAFHVIEGASQFAIMLPDKTSIRAQIVSVDRANDLAILSAPIPMSAARGLALAKSPAPLGATVFTIGYPHPDMLGIRPKFTSGEISSTAGLADDPRILQISTPVQSGNSGGPLINQAGEVVGVISAKLSAVAVLKNTGDLPQNVNYAVKARYLQGLLSEAPSRASVPSKIRPGTVENMAQQLNGAVFLLVAE